MEDSFPDIGSMRIDELKALKRMEGNALITRDVHRLTDILLGSVPDADEAA